MVTVGGNEDGRTVAREGYELITVKEYAKRKRRHPQTVYTAIRTGRFPYAVERPTGGGLLIRLPFHVKG